MSHNDNAHPLTNVSTKYQLPILYNFQDTTQIKVQGSRSLAQDLRPTQGHTMALHTYTPNQCPYQVSTSHTLWFLRYSPDMILKIKLTTPKSKVKSRSHYDVARLHPQPISLSSINFLHLTVYEI